jgi:putative FmdB family regulatory protein
MPIYEYRCSSCNHEFSKLEKMDAPSQGVTCPACGRAHAERRLSTFASTSGAAASPPCGAAAASCGAGFS